jgi:peptidoglycan/LPS O-acetylase OafA/YrhL
MSLPNQKLDQLTTTRFFAAFSVVLFHGGGFLFPFYIFPFDPLLTSGQTAVGYFYVLSGFVMVLAYYRPEKRFNFRAYWVARFSRIYPVYIFAFILTCLYYLDIMSKVKSPKVWANLLLYQAWIPRYSQSFNMAAWSLSVEAFFYIIFPLILLWLPRVSVRRVLWMSLGFWAVSQAIHVVLSIQLLPDGKEFLFYHPLFHLNSFLLGVAGGVWYLTEGARSAIDQKTNWMLLLLGFGLVSLALIARKLTPAWFSTLALDTGELAPFFLVGILALALDRTWLSRKLSHPWLVLLGDASYSLYILHVPIRWLFERALILAGSSLPYERMYLIYLPAILGISVLTFLFLERPARDWLRINIHMLPLFLMDILLIAGAIWVGFLLRIGWNVDSFEKTELLALRLGVVIYFSALLAFRFYSLASWSRLGLAVFFGAAGVTGLLYLAWTQGWVEGFPRTVVFLYPVLVFVFIYFSRFFIRRWRPEMLVERSA